MKRYIFAILFICFFVLCTYCVQNYNVVEVKQVFNVDDLKSNCNIKEVVDVRDSYEIKVYYPETSYNILNEQINDKIKYYINMFKNEIDGLSTVNNAKYQLQIVFSSYEYEDYISYVFDIFYDYAGAHPNTSIWSISYNTKEEKIVDIKYLVDKNKNILMLFSNYSYEALKNDEKIRENFIEEMLKSGTKALEKNFSNFAFDESGLRVFFERYSIAPYSAGQFNILIPYDKLDIL